MTVKKPNVPDREIDKLQKQVDAFDEQVKDLVSKRDLPVQEIEPQTKLSTREIDKNKELYLKPERSVSSSQKFNEEFRDEWNFKKEYVQFIAEHKELIGETIEIWTRPFGGVPAEFWKVPTGKPVWAPRYLAEQIRSCIYHRLRMEQSVTQSDGMGAYYGTLVADTMIPRLTAEPVSKKKSIFMGVAA